MGIQTTTANHGVIASSQAQVSRTPTSFCQRIDWLSGARFDRHHTPKTRLPCCNRHVLSISIEIKISVRGRLAGRFAIARSAIQVVYLGVIYPRLLISRSTRASEHGCWRLSDLDPSRVPATALHRTTQQRHHQHLQTAPPPLGFYTVFISLLKSSLSLCFNSCYDPTRP